ncbi:hypothetical protein AB0C84_45610 [Actinomadura sp. NPDC048955]|uniref:hypothetical protein n=1 Tax=Actinomadura sp. NPDC048955 TaxID=3158228 RepID=UPI003410F291
MTVFEVRELAVIIARAMAVMPASEALDLEQSFLTFIQAKRPDTTAEEWHDLLVGTGHLSS